MCFNSGSHLLKNHVEDDQKSNEKKRKSSCFGPNTYIQMNNLHHVMYMFDHVENLVSSVSASLKEKISMALGKSSKV